MPPKYRKHSSRDIAFVEHGGKRHYLPGAFGSEESRLAYHRFIADLKPQRRSRSSSQEKIQRPVNREATIFDICFAFLEHAERHYPEGSSGTNEFLCCRNTAERLIRFCGILPAAKFGPLKLKEFRERLLAERKPASREGENEKRLSRRYINAHINRVRRIFRWAASEELCSDDVWASLRTVDGIRAGRTDAPELEPRKPVTWEVVAATIEQLAPDLQRAVELQWLTGVRPQAIIHAQANQFDIANRTWSPKNKMEYKGQTLTIPLGPRSLELVQAQIESSNGLEWLFSPIRAGQRRNVRYGLRYTIHSYGQAIKRAQERAGVSPRFTPHQLRHGRATQIREQFGIEAAQAILGHASIDATQIYASRLLEVARRVSEEIG